MIKKWVLCTSESTESMGLITIKALCPGIECSIYVDDFLICYRSKHIHIIDTCNNAWTSYRIGLTSVALNSLPQKLYAYIFADFVNLTLTHNFSWMVTLSLSYKK